MDNSKNFLNEEEEKITSKLKAAKVEARRIIDDEIIYRADTDENQARKLTNLNEKNRRDYVGSLTPTVFIYERAYHFLCERLKNDAPSLPIDIRTVAERCGFTIRREALFTSPTNGDAEPIAQIQMRKRAFGTYHGSVAGVIRVADYLSEASTRFCIAHELGHFFLRTENPIGMMQIRQACPGMYAFIDEEELICDLFAYALLLPYKQFVALKNAYESDATNLPINFANWITYLREKAQMPEYHTVLAYQELRKYHLAKQKIEHNPENVIEKANEMNMHSEGAMLK